MITAVVRVYRKVLADPVMSDTLHAAQQAMKTITAADWMIYRMTLLLVLIFRARFVFCPKQIVLPVIADAFSERGFVLLDQHAQTSK